LLKRFLDAGPGRVKSDPGSLETPGHDDGGQGVWV
jgi:hypothetical protein